MKSSMKYILTCLSCMSAICLSLLYFYLFLFHIADYIYTSFLFAIICLIAFTTFSSIYLLKKFYNIKINTTYMWYFLFLIYLIFLAYLLFFSKNFLRLRLHVQSFDEYLAYLQTTWEYGVNLIPFSSIDDMLSVYNNQAYGNYSFVNIFGNLVAFMPFAFFIKVIYKDMSYWRFIVLVSIVTALVELIQFFSGTGAMDIDDFILNVVGAILMYSILRIPFIHKKLKLIF